MDGDMCKRTFSHIFNDKEDKLDTDTQMLKILKYIEPTEEQLTKITEKMTDEDTEIKATVQAYNDFVEDAKAAEAERQAELQKLRKCDVFTNTVTGHQM